MGCVCVEIRLCVICKHRGRDLGACLCVCLKRWSCVWRKIQWHILLVETGVCVCVCVCVSVCMYVCRQK